MNLAEFKSKYQKVAVDELPSQVPEQVAVSVCVQTYQHVDFIRQCLDGILMQKTNFDFEILLGEDQSTDGTREICLEYARRYPGKIKLFLHQRENNILVNGNPSGRFNYLYNIFSARGKYIAVCEGDDYWTDPLKLQKQVAFLENNPEYVACHHRFIVKDQDDSTVEDFQSSRKKDFTSDEMATGVLMKSNTIMFRNVEIDFPPPAMKIVNGDTFLISQISKYGAGKFLPEIEPSVYRIHDGGVWSLIDKNKKTKHRIQTYKTLAKYATRKQKKMLEKKIYKLNYKKVDCQYRQCRFLLRSGQRKLSIWRAAKMFTKHPILFTKILKHKVVGLY